MNLAVILNTYGLNFNMEEQNMKRAAAQYGKYKYYAHNGIIYSTGTNEALFKVSAVLDLTYQQYMDIIMI